MGQRNINYNIELLRVVSCIFVIGIHLIPTYTEYNGVLSIPLFISKTLIRVAVPVFFMITGYFWNSEKSIVKQYKRFAIHVLAPTIFVVIGSGILLPLFLKYCLGMDEEILSIPMVIKLLLAGKIENFPFCFHLWYIVELVKCYLLLPVLQLLCSENQHEQRIRRYILIIGFVGNILLVSCRLVFGDGFPAVFSYVPITIYMWYILAGYEIHSWMKHHSAKKKAWLFGLIVYLLSSAVVCFCMWHGNNTGNKEANERFYDYAFLAIVVASIAFVFFVLNIKIVKGKKILEILGQATFGIYLIHPVVYSVIWHLGIEKLLLWICPFWFSVIYVTLTYVLSFVIIQSFEVFLKHIRICRLKV